MNKLALPLLAIVLVLTAVLVLWTTLEEPARGSKAPPASAPAAASTPESATLSAGASELTPAPAAATEPALAAERAQKEDLRTADETGTGRTLSGGIVTPPGAPADESLRVIALAEALEPRLVYGVGGVLDELAKGKHAKVVGTTPVDSTGQFTLALAGTDTVWLALDGRFLYSDQIVAVPAETASLTLPAALGACLAGRVSLPAGTADESAVFKEIDLELSPDSSNFSMSTMDRPIRRRAALDANGRFELRAVAAGTVHELEVDSDDCADTKVGALELVPGELRELEVALLSGATLSGFVRDERGQALSGAKVVAAESAIWGFPGEELAETTTDEQGAFTLAHVQPGKCLLLARHDGHLDSESQKLELNDGERREGLEFALGTGAAIAGRARFEDGSPAAGAEIDVSFDPAAMVGMGAMNAARGAKGKTKSGEDGRFEVTGLGKGPFMVVAELERGAGDEKSKWRAKSSSVAPGTRDLELTLAPPCVLSGRVVDLAGAPLREFRVRVHSAGAIFFDPGKTREEPFQDEKGEFVVRDLEAGVWNIVASAKDFGPPAPLEVTLPHAEPVVLTLAPAASVAGSVLDPAGAPVSGAKVTLQVAATERIQRLAGAQRQPEATSTEDGSFHLVGLGAGTSSIVAARDGFASSEAVTVELRAGERSEGAVLRLRKGAVVTGEVYGPDGQLAGGLRIIAQSPGGLDMAMKQSDGKGAFRFENLDPGSWTITALLDGRTVDPEGEADDTSAAFLENMRFSMVQLEEGEEEHVVLGAPPKDPVVVRGVVRHGKEPVTNGLLSFFAEGSKGLETLKMSPLGADGRYEARLNAPGKHVISVQVTGGDAAFQQHTIEFRESIPEVEEHSLDFDLPLGGIQGRVRGPDKEPMANARVTLVTDGGIELGSMMGGQYSEAVTNEAGRYSFAYLRPGSYAVAAGGALFGGAFGTSSSAGRVVRSGLNVDEGRMLADIDFELEKPGDIAGRVVDATGLPLKDVSVFVRDAKGRLLDRFSMIASGGDGAFQYTGVAPGEYLVSARGKGMASAESAPLRVESGASPNVTLVLYPGTKLVIEVVDGEGNAVEARVAVLDQNGREVQGMFGWVEMSSAFAEGFDSSKQTVGPLPPGSYTVTAVPNDGKKTSKPVTLDGQPERRLKLRVR